MVLLSFPLILIAIFADQLFYAHCADEKLPKDSKPSEFKRKLAKSEPLRAAESDPITLKEEDTESISDLGITVPPEFENKTVVKDHHTYYNSTFYSLPDQANHYWVDLDSPKSNGIVHEMLSNSHRQATTVELRFDFPFYGHILRNVTIATGGFLYMGDYLHNWIAATQYVAPLMANFDTSQSSQSIIKYADNGTAFTVHWENAFVQDHMSDGGFTFQVTLCKDGDIIFGYKNIPYPIANISDARHPVKIGISDAYILERALFFVRRKTIYEYHRIDMLKRNISNNTALYFTALPTCPGYKDCTSCMAADPKIECNWCETLKRCSNGIDRSRQTWVANGCVANKPKTCPAQPTSTSTQNSPSEGKSEATSSSKGTESTIKIVDQSTSKNAPSAYNFDSTNSVTGQTENDVHAHAHYMQEVPLDRGISTGAIITIVVFLTTLISAGVWMGYAYKFPQTSSGQFLIKYRPTQWTLKPKDSNSDINNSRPF